MSGFDTIDDLAVCVDCAMLIANGEVTDGEGNDITAEHAERMREVWGDDAVHLVLTCPQNCDGWFFWSRCDGCGSALGGDRHPAAALTPRKDV